ncbi:uncharacterized protein LOC125001018 isoform X2 [Mugil cephalus]|uniref:uncharacterized protein LOC125001018 isoform X2 n=1 Tax=Mugil cephalus TaxID=48193 RepID=UPI001FB5A43E|nr:uncharacterized protein LOC125001018 isoform X2 [Mugil cephalus]
MENKLSNMVDCNELYQKPYSYIRPFNRIRGQKEEPDSAGSDLDLPEPTEKRSLTEEQSSMFTRAPHGVWTHPSVIREQKKGSEFDEVKHQLLRGSEEEGSSDCESVFSCVSFKSDRSMPHFIDFKDSRPSAPKRMENKLSNMVDLMKEREDAMMAHMKPKRDLEDEGSDSTESEHEPSDEPSSHSDSDDKSSCVSFNSDRLLNHITDFKGSRPSALKRKRLEEEGSD